MAGRADRYPRAPLTPFDAEYRTPSPPRHHAIRDMTSFASDRHSWKRSRWRPSARPAPDPVRRDAARLDRRHSDRWPADRVEGQSDRPRDAHFPRKRGTHPAAARMPEAWRMQVFAVRGVPRLSAAWLSGSWPFAPEATASFLGPCGCLPGRVRYSVGADHIDVGGVGGAGVVVSLRSGGSIALRRRCRDMLLDERCSRTGRGRLPLRRPS
jgi:hypothetical protein